MKVWEKLLKLICRFRHQVSLPEDVSAALGVPLSNFSSLPFLLQELSSPYCRPTRLSRFMDRKQAEAAFAMAVKIERFSRHTLCSYYFKNGWLEFILHFDEQHKLRRLYLHHRDLSLQDGVELVLEQRNAFCHTRI